MKKRLIVSISMACIALGVNAKSLFMTVEMTNGSMISFKLDDNPVITYEDGSFVVNKNSETTYAFDDIKNYHFTETEESSSNLSLTTPESTISEEEMATSFRVVWTDDETIELQNAKIGAVAILVTTNGMLTSKEKVDSEGKAYIKVPRAAGVYVLSVGNQSFKIIRK